MLDESQTHQTNWQLQLQFRGTGWNGHLLGIVKSVHVTRPCRPYRLEREACCLVPGPCSSDAWNYDLKSQKRHIFGSINLLRRENPIVYQHRRNGSITMAFVWERRTAPVLQRRIDATIRGECVHVHVGRSGFAMVRHRVHVRNGAAAVPWLLLMLLMLQAHIFERQKSGH